MKKTLHLTMMLVLSVVISFAQTAIPNASFENWDNAGSANAEPTTWNSNKSGTGYASYGPQTCFESNTAHSGNHSAQVTSSTYFGTVVNGSLTTGQVAAPTTTKSDGYISSVVGNTGYIASFTGRPDSLIFWYQYTSVSSDYATVQARLHVGSAYAPEAATSYHAACAQNIIARALWQGPSSNVSTWTRVAIPFVYDSVISPSYILISTTSSGNQNGGSSGSSLLLDDFLAYYIPVLATGSVPTGPYYVTASNSTSVSVPFTLTGTVDSSNVVTAQLSNASGSFASPVNIGTLTTMSSGTITASIPAGTLTGTGYRIRVISSAPVLTAADNGSNIIIDVVSNSVAPATTQNIAANANGNTLTVTESVAPTSRQWEYSTTSGSGYVAFGTAQTAATYIPSFATAGTYYVVCVSTYPGNLNVTSNQVQVNVVSSSIAPTTAQSILVGVNGTPLAVTESSTATSRQWKYSTTSGSGYVAFGSPQTGTGYTPNFASAGTYYVVCQSLMNGVTATSNEVLISVGSATITTQPVTGSPFLFSHSAPAASVAVAYVTSGTFNNGNIFTAQLSDASGSFATPVAIGTHTAAGSGTITASIPSSTAAGNHYRIRVVSSSPVIAGSDNGSDLVIDQFHSSVAPATTQNILFNANGNTLTVTASQTSTYNWQYSTTSGSGYTDFSPAQTGSTYVPSFATPGTYYVVCVSKNQYNDLDTSNEVEIIVQNGSTLTTLNVVGSPFLVSDSSNIQVNVGYTSNVNFGAGNTFDVQLSDNTGGFSAPVTIGSLASTAGSGVITATIPNSSVAGTNYRIRVVSSNPALTGTSDSLDLTVISFAVAVSPLDTQYLVRHQNGNILTATSTQPATYNWQYSEVSGMGYNSFSPAQTGDTLIPSFVNVNTYYVVCNVTNAAHASLYTNEVVIIVSLTNGINNLPQSIVKAYWDNNDFVVDLSGAKLNAPAMELVSVTGQVVYRAPLTGASVNRFATQLTPGMYLFRVMDGDNSFNGKTVKK